MRLGKYPTHEEILTPGTRKLSSEGICTNISEISSFGVIARPKNERIIPLYDIRMYMSEFRLILPERGRTVSVPPRQNTSVILDKTFKLD